MPPARGRGSARGTKAGSTRGSRGRSASVASVPGNPTCTNLQLCGTCCKDVGDDSIGCDECEVWVHNTVMCSGLSGDMLEAINRYDGAGIKFVCTKCRRDFSVKRGGSPSSSTEMHLVELVKHLSQQVMGICSVVQQLQSEFNLIRSQPGPAKTCQSILQPPEHAHATNPLPSQSGTPVATPASGPPPSEYRKVVREELRELQEQQKRRSSLVIRGLGAGSASAAIAAFEHVSEYLINQKVTLTDVVRIPSESDLFRGKVPDDSARRLILDKAKQLKESPRYGFVFIRRDLTFKQRSELRAKREAAAHGNSSNRPNANNPSLPVGSTSALPTSVSDQQSTHIVQSPVTPNSHDMVDTIPKCVDGPKSN